MPSILENKHYNSDSVFSPENLLREARRQKNIDHCPVPKICVLDPDGDMVTYLLSKGMAEKSTCWACYHSQLYQFDLEGTIIGILPCIVGASYAVLVAEQLFASGCELLISVTSAGMIAEPEAGKRFVLIAEAVRDEGTSYHYIPAEMKAAINQERFSHLSGMHQTLWYNGKSWTTDAPYRETQMAIDAMSAQEVVCVEMEAAALYAFAMARGKDVVCFAHLTNTMAQQEGDFEKGEHFGSIDTLDLLKQIIHG